MLTVRLVVHAELSSGVSSDRRVRRDSRGSHSESDDDSTDLDDENYHEVVNSYCQL